ncbi:MAG: serine/threonine protein kinase [Alphaproteobacteria bacterium]|nr:serine/threonine protein kinase [Alphaproteobacteria bacterium]MCB9698654.1 serine/threonine protein kinase [Alphaproteobacteria bacterium]
MGAHVRPPEMGRDRRVYDPDATLDATVTGDGDRPPIGELPDGVLVGRYELGEVLGRGGSAEVRAARDLITGEAVAVKFVPLLGEHVRRQLRRELSALLALRIPGVVRLRDEGTVFDRSFFVTQRIDGVPFTEGAGTSWTSWRPRVLGLLDVLARIHLAGVVHRDLKPANVLVDRAGRVVVLDFGLAQGRSVEVPTGGLVEGTPRYMAPEQRDARPSDERTDLYAAGGMILELVTGEPLTRPPRFDALRTAPVPPALVEVVEQMLAEDREDRPASALEVLARLDADPRDDIGAGMPRGPWSERTLRRLFVDRARSFLHLATDAAALLFEETGGDEERTRAVLQRWIRLGLASWSGDGRVVVTRAAIEQLAASRPGAPQAELVALLEAGADPEEVGALARRIGRRLAEDGHLERALALLEAAELWARGSPAELGLLEDRVTWSLGLETTAAADQALHGVQRAEIDPEARHRLTALLRGARSALGGDPRRALEQLADQPPGLPEDLDVYWHALRWKAASQLDVGTHAGELEALEPWARQSETRLGKWMGWSGYLRYRQQRYTEAAALLSRAAESRRVGRERALMLYMAAAAWLEAGAFDEARQATEAALPLLREARQPLHEAMVVCLSRWIALRAGPPGSPDLELVAAADDVPGIRPHLLLVEAGFAFRSGDLATCASLAERARDGVAEDAREPAAVLAGALWVAVAPATARIERGALLGVLPQLTPQVAIQALGLLAWGDGPSEAMVAPARGVLLALRDRDPDARLELLSVREAAERLGLSVEEGACPST